MVRKNNRLDQVKYLCNPPGGWINEHHIKFIDGVDDYALVLIVNLELKTTLVFPKETIAQVCRLLNKRHPNQDVSLQLTNINCQNILSMESVYSRLGVYVYHL